MKKLVREHFEQFVQCRDSVEKVGYLTTENRIWPEKPKNYKGGKIKAEKVFYLLIIIVFRRIKI